MAGKRRPRSHLARAELAKRQYGVVSIRQLRGPLGCSERAVEREVARGELHRLHRGVYAVGHARISLHGRCLAAVLACGPNALLSHTSAAWLWGISTQGPLPFHVTAPKRRCPGRPIVLHHARALLSEDRALVETVPVTSLSRTFLDSAAIVRGWRLERMLERAEELQLFDLGPIEQLLARTAGHPGHGRLRRARALPATGFTRSGIERRFLELVKEAGLPQPRTCSSSTASSSMPTGPRSASRSNLTPTRPTGRMPPSSATGCGRRT